MRLLKFNPGYCYCFSYANWRGETGVRLVKAVEVWWGLTDFHKEEPQFFLRAIDLDRGAQRDFAIKDIFIPIIGIAAPQDEQQFRKTFGPLNS